MKVRKSLGLLSLWLGKLLHGQPDIFYGKLTFRVAPPDSVLWAEVEWHFTRWRADTLIWDLGEGLDVQTVEASFGVQAFWRNLAQRKVYILPHTPLSGAPAWVRVRYTGVPRSSGFGSYEIKPHSTGWTVWTLSQPYGAPDWLFCRDGLSDKVDSLDICIITPDTLLGVANGKLIADTIDAHGWRWRHFRHRYPIAVYLIAFAASNYIVQEFPVQTTFHRFILRNYVYPQDTGRARLLSEQFLPYFQWLEERIGPYPFANEDYNQVQIGWGGGMEHQTITFFGSYSLELWAHELAHQWFGDWVTCGSWQDIWLNEAFATYLGGTAYEAIAQEWWKVWRHHIVRHAWQDTQRTIFVEDTADMWRIFHYPTTYAKGAIALHGLRLYVGELAFWQGLREYLMRYAGGFARTAQFQEAVEEAWGREVTHTFLQSWIYRPHYPRAAVVWQDQYSCTISPTERYPLRVPLRVRFISGDSAEYMVDLMQSQVSLSFPKAVWSWEIDADTVYPYWGVRRGIVTSAEGRVFPNPFTDQLYISMEGLRKAVLYDLAGRIVAVYEGASQRGPITWELSGLASGTYLLRIEGEKGTYTMRLLHLSP